MGTVAASAFVSDFKANITRDAQDNEWTLAEISDDRAVLKLEGESGREQTVYILKYPHTVEFSVPSELSFRTDRNLGEASTYLLQHNSDLRIGFWCLEKIEGRWTFEIMHNEPLDQLEGDYFGDIVESLVKECDDFETAMAED